MEPKLVQIIGKHKAPQGKVLPQQMRVSRATRATNVSYNPGQILRPDSSPEVAGNVL